LELRKRKKADLLKELQKLGFKTMSELDAILEQTASKAAADAADAEAVKEAAADPDAEKSDYDYLLGMNLWSLTFEKVEELKQQHEVKREELDALRKTTIETMWDRDLEEVKKALDDLDKLEGEEAEAAAAFAEGRKKKDASRSAATAAKKKAPAKTAEDKTDKALLKRPLQDGVSLEGIEKQTWGSGATFTRKVSEPEAGARGEELPAAAPKMRKRAAGGADATEPPSAPKEEGGASLLSRLLGKSSDSAVAKPSYEPLGLGSSLSSFSTLGNSEDLFGYLKTSKPSGGDANGGKTFNALDPPPASGDKGESEETPGHVGGNGRGKGRGKARGRGRANKADDDEDAAEQDAGAQPAKRRKSSE